MISTSFPRQRSVHSKRPETLNNLSLGDGVHFEFEIFEKNLPDDTLRITNSEDVILEVAWPAGAIKMIGLLAMPGIGFSIRNGRLEVGEEAPYVLRIIDTDPWVNPGIRHGYGFAFCSDLAWCLSEFTKEKATGWP